MARSPSSFLLLLPLAAQLACGVPPEAHEAGEVSPEGPPEVADLGTSRAALVSLDSTGTKVLITGTSGADTASVKYPLFSTDSLIVTLNGTSTTYSLNTRIAITSISFSGGAGNDTFTNLTSLPCTANGNDGDDVLNGGSGADFLIGDYGNDTLDGNAGADVLWGSGDGDVLYGGTGDDTLYGHGGADELHGEDGNDLLNGGSSNDLLYGEAGQDTLMAVGLGTDTLTGGTHADYIWKDSADSLTDAALLEVLSGYVHTISGFHHISYNGGLTSTPIGLEPLGEDLADPFPTTTSSALSLVNFKDRPLFGPSGPNKLDINQGAVGDCYFVASLASIADSNPEFIRNMVIGLGDGTYAVRFYQAGAPVYVRVDADLWVYEATGQPQNAKLGTGGALWVPIVEKAYTIMRRDRADYDSISGGDGTLDGHLNLTLTPWSYDDGITKEQMLQWVQSGSPAGPLMDARNAGVEAFLAWVQEQRAQGVALIAGSVSGVSDNTAITDTSWRRGQHIYMVDRVLTDATGKRVGIVLRDPYGVDREIRDFTRIYYCIGGASRWEL
jgi:hypothetical protein